MSTATSALPSRSKSATATSTTGLGVVTTATTLGATTSPFEIHQPTSLSREKTKSSAPSPFRSPTPTCASIRVENPSGGENEIGSTIDQPGVKMPTPLFHQ